MPWDNTPAKRARDAKVYGPEWRKARALALKRSGGRCEQALGNGRRCGTSARVQVDHVIPVSQGGTHHLDNLQVLCMPHHLAKTAQEGKGFRAGGRRGRGGRRFADDPPLAGRTKW